MKWTPRVKHLSIGALLALGFCSLAVVFGIYDLPISERLAGPENWLGSSLEYLGTLIAPCLVVLAGLAVVVSIQKAGELPHRRLALTFGCLAALGGVGYGVHVCLKLSWTGALGVLLAAVLLCAIWIRWLLLLDRRALERLLRIAVLTIVYVAVVFVVVGVIKVFWGRVRYRDMAFGDKLDLEDFTRWFLPQGITGNASFPSGHTANAATLYVLTLFAPLVRHKWAKFLCYFVPIVTILVMAVSRVLAGAHYASDVLVGGSLAILLFYLLKGLFRRCGVDWSFRN